MRHDIPNLKRLWYCQQKYEKTTGCVCKKSGVCECQSILNIPIAEIDEIRSEKRKQRQKKRYSFWDLDFAQVESHLYLSRGIDMMRQMIVSRKEMLRLAYGGPRPSPIFDQVILDEAMHLRPLGIGSAVKNCIIGRRLRRKIISKGNPKSRSRGRNSFPITES